MHASYGTINSLDIAHLADFTAVFMLFYKIVVFSYNLYK